ncbi:MAG TPA: hypothetical protein VLC10_04855 [Patescibacteria group bacterium]|nr:hypothetical protein [Patescibacteria group bacterium]
MPVFTLEPAQSVALADSLLHSLREVRDLVSQPPDIGTLERVADILRGAKAALDEAVKVPDSRSPDRETGISRQGIIMTVEEAIALLARLKVALGMHLAKGEPLSAEPVRVFVSASVIIGSLLATPTLNPRLEVGDVEHHAADPFPGA